MYWNQGIRRYGSTCPFSPAGPIQNLLGCLNGRCPNLRTLTLRKVGQSRGTEFTPEFAAKDVDLFRFCHLHRLCKTDTTTYRLRAGSMFGTSSSPSSWSDGSPGSSAPFRNRFDSSPWISNSSDEHLGAYLTYGYILCGYTLSVIFPRIPLGAFGEHDDWMSGS